MAVPDKVIEEAFDWLIRLEEASSDKLSQQFQNWVSQSEQHQEAWRQALRTWQMLGRQVNEVQRDQANSLQHGPGEKLKHMNTKSKASSGGRFSLHRWHMGVLAAAACVFMLVLPSLRIYLLADFQTGSGETQAHILPDGTKLVLGAESAVRLFFEGERRHVELLSGQAFFRVAAGRNQLQEPFEVMAGSLLLSGSGSIFDLNIGVRSFSVNVKNGGLALTYGQEKQPAEHQLNSGQGAVIERVSGKVDINAVFPESVGSWAKGRLFVHNLSMEDVVGILNRYIGGQVFIFGRGIKAKKMTGSIDIQSPVLAMQSLVNYYNGEMIELTPFLRLLRFSKLENWRAQFASANEAKNN